MSLLQQAKAKLQGKKVVTSEELALELLESTLRGGQILFEEFQEVGLVAQLSTEDASFLSAQCLTFELVCETLSLAHLYGGQGFKVGETLLSRAFMVLGEASQVKNLSRFVEAGCNLFSEHFQFYSESIWNFWATAEARQEDAPRQAVSAGDKVLRKVFNPILGIPLELPKQGIDGASVEWCRKVAKQMNQIPNWYLLSSSIGLFSYASLTSLQQLSQKVILQEDS